MILLTTVTVNQFQSSFLEKCGYSNPIPLNTDMAEA